jgi:Fe-S cluster assembly protein SufD
MSAAGPVERLAAGGLPRSGGEAWGRRRRRALDALLARGLPDRRDENWKYLDHARIAGYDFGRAPSAAADAAALAPLLLPLAGAPRVVLLDGRYAPALSDALPAGAGVEVADLSALVERDPDGALSRLRAPGDDPDERYALLAEAFAGGGVLVRAAPGSAPAHPLYVVHAATAAEPAVHQARLAIEAGRGARLAVVEHFVTLGAAAALGNLAAEATLAQDAELVHVRLHGHAAAAAQVETWDLRLAAGSRYVQHLLALGGRVLRSNLAVALEGAGSACRLDGLFLADGDRQVDLLTRVAHHGTATVTAQECRGIAAGRGRGAFNGRIDVHRTARGANASQSSRNLLLTPLAEINARPQLEIQVDEVQCRHGATTGSLDPGQLFYLESRGIDPATARALLTFAFCRDLIARVPYGPVRDAAEALVAGSLPDRDLVRGLG